MSRLSRGIMFQTFNYTHFCCKELLDSQRNIHSDRSHLHENNLLVQCILRTYFCILFHTSHRYMLRDVTNYLNRVRIISFRFFLIICNLKIIKLYFTHVLHNWFLSSLHYIRSHMIRWRCYNRNIYHCIC